MKKLLPTTLTAAMLTAGSLVAAPASAELDASVSLASLYLFRGVDASDGGAQISGDLTYSVGGFYAGTWVSNADGAEEYDLLAGWAGEFGGVGLDVGLVNYMYPDDSSADSFGDYSEAYVGVSYAGVDLYYYDNIAGDNGYTYTSLGYAYDQFSATLGYAETDDSSGGVETDTSYTHLDLSYAYNDNLTFTVSKILDREYEETTAGVSCDAKCFALASSMSEKSMLDSLVADDDLIVMVSYSLPIDL